MPDKLLELTAVFAIVLVAVAYLAVRAWRGRAIAHSKLIGDLPSAFDLGNADAFDGFYVATTPAGKPLDRLVGSGLAHRGRVTVRVSKAGVSMERTGEATINIPSAQIIGVAAQSATIDRAVESGGLTAIHWSNSGHEFETFLRMQSADAHRAIASHFSQRSSKEQR
jgi:hypothetical protein